MSDDREAELRALEQELRDPRYIEKPDTYTVDIGGQCFLDRHRVCGPDCTAFLGPEGPTAAERCALLTGINGMLELFEVISQSRKKTPVAPPNIAPPNPMPKERP